MGERYPKAAILEMETHILYTLAERSVPGKKIYGGCACIGLFHRKTKRIVPEDRVHFLEKNGGKEVLESLAEFKFPEGEPENTERLLRKILNGLE